jgi:hypothetical protein
MRRPDRSSVMKPISRAQAVTLAGVLLIIPASGRLLSHDLISTKVTWTHDISRILQARCTTCHVAGGRSTIPLTTYEEARPWARAIREQVLSRQMPIWQAARGYGDFANDPSLSPFEVGLIAAWVDGGAPKGTDADTGQGKRDTGQVTREKGQGTSEKAEGTPGTGKLEGAGMRPPEPQTRQVALPCGNQPVMGRLVAVNPQLVKGGSAGIAAVLPDGRREVVAWIRNYDPNYPTTYWLRAPLSLPRGSRLTVDATGTCTLTATLAR